jgi:hypothetical protein
MSSIEQIIAEHKRKQAEAEAKKVVMTRREWLEYLPKEYCELCVAVHVPEKADDPVSSMYEAVLYGGRDVEKWPFWHEHFWIQLCNWAEGKRDTLPPIPGIHKYPIPWVEPESKGFIPEFEGAIDEPSIPKPVKKEYHPLEDVRRDNQIEADLSHQKRHGKSKAAMAIADKSNPSLQPLLSENEVIATEVITTRHTIPYNGGNLPLFSSL